MPKKYTPQCACGAVKFEFDKDPDFIAVCHCVDCKKASGGEAATWFGMPEDDFTLLSSAPKEFHYVADSDKGLDQNFCPECAARLYTSNLERFPGLVFVQLASLSRPELIEPKLEMYVKRRLKWVKPLDMPHAELNGRVRVRPEKVRTGGEIGRSRPSAPAPAWTRSPSTAISRASSCARTAARRSPATSTAARSPARAIGAPLQAGFDPNDALLLHA